MPCFALRRPPSTHRVEGLDLRIPHIVLQLQQTRKDVAQACRPPRLPFRGHCPKLWASLSPGGAVEGEPARDVK